MLPYNNLCVAIVTVRRTLTVCAFIVTFLNPAVIDTHSFQLPIKYPFNPALHKINADRYMSVQYAVLTDKVDSRPCEDVHVNAGQ